MLFNDPDIVDATPEKITKNRRKKKLKMRHKIETTKTLEEFLELEKKYRLYKIGSGSEYNNPYVYFDIKEIRQFTNQNRVLKFNNILLIGFYQIDSKFGKILSDSQEIDVDNMIKLDFKLSSDKPIERSVLSVYGAIEYEPHPVLLVQFFRTENEGYMEQSKETLKFVRNFVPRCCFEVISTN